MVAPTGTIGRPGWVGHREFVKRSLFDGPDVVSFSHKACSCPELPESKSKESLPRSGNVQLQVNCQESFYLLLLSFMPCPCTCLFSIQATPAPSQAPSSRCSKCCVSRALSERLGVLSRGQITLLGQEEAIAIDEELMSTPGPAQITGVQGCLRFKFQDWL